MLTYNSPISFKNKYNSKDFPIFEYHSLILLYIKICINRIINNNMHSAIQIVIHRYTYTNRQRYTIVDISTYKYVDKYVLFRILGI